MPDPKKPNLRLMESGESEAGGSLLDDLDAGKVAREEGERLAQAERTFEASAHQFVTAISVSLNETAGQDSELRLKALMDIKCPITFQDLRTHWPVISGSKLDQPHRINWAFLDKLGRQLPQLLREVLPKNRDLVARFLATDFGRIVEFTQKPVAAHDERLRMRPR